MPSRAPPRDEPRNSSQVTSRCGRIRYSLVAPRLQFEIDRHEIVVGYAAHKNRRARSDNRRRSRDWMEVANREPIKFRPHRSRNQSGESERRVIRKVDALDLEPMLSQMFEQRFVCLRCAEPVGSSDHFPGGRAKLRKAGQLRRRSIQIAAENRATGFWKRLEVGRHLTRTFGWRASAMQMSKPDGQFFSAEIHPGDEARGRALSRPAPT